jgi:hypothetical protein
LSTRTDHTQVIRGLRDGKVVYVFATNQTRNGFQVAGDLGLEGIPFGAARFVHVWGTDVRIPRSLPIGSCRFKARVYELRQRHEDNETFMIELAKLFMATAKTKGEREWAKGMLKAMKALDFDSTRENKQ